MQQALCSPGREQTISEMDDRTGLAADGGSGLRERGDNGLPAGLCKRDSGPDLRQHGAGGKMALLAVALRFRNGHFRKALLVRLAPVDGHAVHRCQNYQHIRAYQLGEVYARNMGVPIKAFRAALILLSSVLSACVTAFAGPISFVGIALPHLMKALFKTAEPLLLIPASFLGGGIFCLACDLIARTAFAPTEVSISSVTAVFGAPVVIYMMVRRKAGRE